MGIEQFFKTLLGKSGYSDKAADEVWKWYTVPPKKSKSGKKWHHKAMLIDPRRTKLAIVNTEEFESQVAS